MSDTKEDKIQEIKFKGVDRRNSTQCELAAFCGVEELNSTFTAVLSEIRELKSKVESLEAKTEDLLTAWLTTKGVISFVKLLGSLAVGVGIIAASFKNWKF